MNLVSAHKILIIAAIVMAALFGLWAVYTYSKTSAVVTLGMGSGSVVLAIGLIFYLRWFLAKARR